MRIEILDEAQVYARELEAQWAIPDFNVRVGISTGLVIIGGDTEAENTIMGTTVSMFTLMLGKAKMSFGRCLLFSSLVPVNP